ncbi:MAG TPA: dienelactone hydrolase family protein [Acidimicrobiales bacterium]|nr:dienelactone hydrolase family protein [Acidimicrobiales bacterium]
MSEIVELPGNGATARGHLFLPPGGTGPGVVVVQEWWGVDATIKEMASRVAAAGFVALVPDLFHGELAGHDEIDKAAQLMQALPLDRAARDMSGAVDFLAAHEAVTGDGLGVVGFCMGGMLTWVLAVQRADRIRAAVPFYGYPSGEAEPDWSALSAAVQAHMAENDVFFPAEGAMALDARLRALGKDVTVTVHPGTGHAFMNPANPVGTLDEETGARIWPGAMAFLHRHLG